MSTSNKTTVKEAIISALKDHQPDIEAFTGKVSCRSCLHNFEESAPPIKTLDERLAFLKEYKKWRFSSQEEYLEHVVMEMLAKYPNMNLGELNS